MDGYAREGGELHPAWGLRGVALSPRTRVVSDDARRRAEDGLALAIERGDRR